MSKQELRINNVKLGHELKSLIDGSIKDIDRFDNIVREIAGKSYKKGYSMCIDNLHKSIDKLSLEEL